MNLKSNLMIGTLALLTGFVAGWSVNGWRLSAYQEAEKAEQIQSNADHFRDATEKINAEASQYSGNSRELEKQIANLKKELSDAKKNHPVPAGCRPGSDRLRVLKDAVRAANSAAGQ